jgi:hypothetical protein
VRDEKRREFDVKRNVRKSASDGKRKESSRKESARKREHVVQKSISR